MSYMDLPEYPPNVQIELSNYCNANCNHCPIPKMKRKRNFMDFELFKKIICELESENFEGSVLPFLHGESLLTPNFVNYLRFIKNKLPNTPVTLYTNASALTKDLSMVIIKEELLDNLIISIDGGTKETYESIRKNLSFEMVRQNVKSFMKIRGESSFNKPNVTVTMVITPQNHHTMKDLENEFKHVDEINFSIFYNWAQENNKKNKLKLPYFLTKANYCMRMYEYINILENGNVCLCCFDYEGMEILGNINESSIKEIWLGKEYQNRRQYLERRMFSELPLCVHCDTIDHNLITQKLIKHMPSIQTRFPKLTKNIIEFYKSLKF